MEPFKWMQWNWAGSLFFLFLVFSIAGLTYWDARTTVNRRKGFLPLETTRGDRLFIGIMSSIGIMLLWLALVGNQMLGILSVFLILWNSFLAWRG